MSETKPEWDRQFAESEVERNARLRAKRLARRGSTEKVTEPAELERCPECDGGGLVRRTVQYLFAGTIAESVIAVDCPTCHGSGVTKGEE